MAVDTEQKRCTAPNHFMFQLLPSPHGFIVTPDRAHLDVYIGTPKTTTGKNSSMSLLLRVR